jgi:hypothetical protein
LILVLTESPETKAEWDCMGELAQRNFEGLDDGPCWDGWPRIHRLLLEGRDTDVKVGCREDNPTFWEAAEAYVWQTIEEYKSELRRGVNGVPILSPP